MRIFKIFRAIYQYKVSVLPLPYFLGFRFRESLVYLRQLILTLHYTKNEVSPFSLKNFFRANDFQFSKINLDFSLWKLSHKFFVDSDMNLKL